MPHINLSKGRKDKKSVLKNSMEEALGHSPEEIARKYGHISVAQVYAALAHYHANQDEIEAEIAVDEAEADRIEQEYLQEQQTAS